MQIRDYAHKPRGGWRAFWRGFEATVVIGLFLVTVPGVRPDPDQRAFSTLGYARDYLFNFVDWEANTLTDKGLVAAVAPQQYMSDEERTQYVRDYLQLVSDIGQLESQIEDIYIDPSTTDPDTASADLRAQRDALRARQQSEQALAESIIQSQVEEMLTEYGFGVGGQVLPPVVFRFTELPTVLIVSRRDRIERIGTYPLQHGLTVEQMETIENNVDQALGVSSIVEPIGGLAVWPAMLIETGYLPSVYEVAAHEWTHHYLTFFPLGFNYGQTPDLTTINETTANIVGQEIGWAVLNRYYPDMAPSPPDYSPQPATPETPAQPQEPPAFDFNAEMRITRVHVDELLAEGKIDEAEQYMEQRRIVFVEHGYRIRKLNQAYFAFHGSYADQPGATGSDPIGPALRQLRYESPSLIAFVERVRNVTSLEELQAAVEAAQNGSPGG